MSDRFVVNVAEATAFEHEDAERTISYPAEEREAYADWGAKFTPTQMTWPPA